MSTSRNSSIDAFSIVIGSIFLMRIWQPMDEIWISRLAYYTQIAILGYVIALRLRIKRAKAEIGYSQDVRFRVVVRAYLLASLVGWGLIKINKNVAIDDRVEKVCVSNLSDDINPRRRETRIGEFQTMFNLDKGVRLGGQTKDRLPISFDEIDGLKSAINWGECPINTVTLELKRGLLGWWYIEKRYFVYTNYCGECDKEE